MTDPTPLEQLAAYGEAMQEGDPSAFVTRSTVAKLLAAAFHVIADKDAEIARLQAELDGLREVHVEHVPTAGLEAAMATADPGRKDGAVIQELGGQKRAFRWDAAAGAWEQVHDR